MPRPEDLGLLALAERRELRLPSGESLRTPLVVPSFSSRIPDIEKVFRSSEEFLDASFLISAFDVANGFVKPPFHFAGPVFLDSGGYEIGPDTDLSDVTSEPTGQPDDWSREQHQEVLTCWAAPVPTIVISYDHPQIRADISEQIERARTMALPNNSARELLVKPDTRHSKFIAIDKLVAAVRDMTGFHAIGITEKEIGNSVLERMINIAKLRIALRKIDLHTPIHVFGSLDSITTLFYFIAGADIFDGLTWLRYAFKDGHTYYRQDFGIGEFGIATKSPKVEALCWARNYHYIKEMELEMRRFLTAHEFSVFRHHSGALRDAYQSVEEEVG